MSKYYQQGQKVNTQINAENVNVDGDINITSVLEPTECYSCGKLCLPNDAYRCKKCQACLLHNPSNPNRFSVL